MGSWNGTCMISNLPILSGEEVKLVFLHRPYSSGQLHKPAYCYPNGIFHPAAFALNGKYDDYGSVEDIEEDFNYNLVNLFFKLTFKAIEVEGKILEDFNLYNILEGIERGSLKVLAEGDAERKKIAEGAIEAYSKHGFSSKKVEEEWRKLADEDVSEIWRESTLNFVMIRKDVWDGIIAGHKTEYWIEDEKDRKEPNVCYQTAQEWVEKRFKKFKNIENSLFKRFLNPISTAGYAGGTKMLLDNYYQEALLHGTDEQIDIFQKLFTEMTIIESFLSATRKGWMITCGSGSQSNEWSEYQLLNKIVNDICVKELQEYDEES
jgi:hypothetical protein